MRRIDPLHQGHPFHPLGYEQRTDCEKEVRGGDCGMLSAMRGVATSAPVLAYPLRR